MNLVTTEIELLIRHPTDMAAQAWANGRFALDNDVTSTVAALTTSIDAETEPSTMTTAMNGKVNSNQVLTNVPANALFTDTTLTNYSETAGGTTTVFEGFDDAAPVSTHLSWTNGAYTNVASSHQLITIPVYHRFSGLGSGTCYMTIQLKAGTTNEAVFSINDSTAWVHVREIKFSSLSTSSWTTVSWSFPIPPNRIGNFHIGFIPAGSNLTQASSNLLIKNLRKYKTGAIATISSHLNCSEDVICSRTVTATGYSSTSDRSIKDDVQNAIS